MPFAKEAKPSCCPHRSPGPSRDAPFTEHCFPLIGPEPCFQILGAMNRIMAEHFEVHPANDYLHIPLHVNSSSACIEKLEENGSHCE